MILENGVIRTLDPSLPVARALAIAGDRIAGGVGVHETALASPETVDLGGRCVLPGFTDSHVHFPTWAVAQHEVRLDGCSSLAKALGVTCVNDKDGWLGAAGLWQQLEAKGALSLRVWQSVPADMLPELRALSLRSGFGSQLLRVGYLKVFMDGTLGSQTAWMLDGSGVQITSSDELAEIVRAGAEAGWPVGVHAIGDLANREALDAFERTRDAWQPRGLRQRIEHAQCLTSEDVPRFAGLGVAVSAQFTHAPSDEHLAKKFWGDKLAGTYSFRSLLESGTLVANGSDAPVEAL